ncbi:hypothetical protein AN958_04393 [Leucoagaricus sp. SymC.cos]|nr:hypothetical protein AN958_04393 [Leucoagaricus sp. SymC.cos]
MVGATPPTSCLPPIRGIPLENLDSINASLRYLRSVYHPEVRGSRRRRKSLLPRIRAKLTTPDVSSPLLAASLSHLRTDPFERAYAMKWLTALISSFDCGDEEMVGEKEKTLQNAASLLAVCAGTSAAGTVIRDFTFFYVPPIEDSGLTSPIPITVKLTDISLDNNDFGSVGAQTWGGACVLSDMLVEDPGAFGISAKRLNNQERREFRILELGAGTGLVSLIVGKLLEAISLEPSHEVEIVATDYYPSVLTNLRTNAQNNIPHAANSSVKVLTHALDWSSFGSASTKVAPFNQPFDLILGADIVYEPEHATWIHSCITHLLRKPSVSAESSSYIAFFHLVMPLRATHAFESKSVETVFTADTHLVEDFSLQVLHNDTIVCETDTGEEVEYIYFRIGWK